MPALVLACPGPVFATIGEMAEHDKAGCRVQQSSRMVLTSRQDSAAGGIHCTGDPVALQIDIVSDVV
jgi:hypothetical protein